MTMKGQTIVIIVCVLIAILIIVVFMILNKSEYLSNNQVDSDKCVKNLTTYYKDSEFDNKNFHLGYKEGLKNEVILLVNEYNLNYEEPRSNSTPYLIIKTQKGEVLKQICILSSDGRIKEKVRYIEPNFIYSIDV